MTKQGNAWAIITFADRDGSLEVLFFPAVYQLVQHALIEDSVIAVKGRIEDRDGTINIFGRELEVTRHLLRGARRPAAGPAELPAAQGDLAGADRAEADRPAPTRATPRCTSGSPARGKQRCTPFPTR